MIAGLRRVKLDRHAREQVHQQLCLGPWLWPEDPSGRARAHAVVPQGPPRVQPGQALLLSVHPTTTSLWLLRLQHTRAAGAAGLRVAPFGPKARSAWAMAAAVLPRSLPVLWHAVQALDRMPIEAVWLSSLAEPGCVEARETVIDGSSFGLSLLLGMASFLFDRPLPEDLAASAELEGGGALRPVEGLERKARMLSEHAPRVRRMLVAASQARELGEAMGERLQVVGVRTVAEALDEVFGSELSSLLIGAGQDSGRRTELVRAFFRLAISGRGSTVDWTPVAQGARLAQEHWPDLDCAQRQALEFARMVAQRHEGSGAAAVLPEEGWLAGLAAPVRLEVVAHYVQQSADTGQPEPAAIRKLAERLLVRGPDAFLEHLRLLGALGRLLALTGAPVEAMRMQAEAAVGLLERMAAADLSYPLSEWYRLAGALGDPEAFEQAERVRAQAAHLRTPEDRGQAYVALSRARAQVHLGRAEAARDALAELASDSALAVHVRWSAVRWLLRTAEARGERTERPEAQELRAAGHRGTRIAARYLELIELDRAVGRGRQAQAAALVASMAAREPGLLRNLLDAAPAGMAREPWIARFYPY